MNKNRDAADVIAAARMRVYLRHPYLSCALFALRPHPAPGLGTLAVDAGWRLYYDPDVALRWQAEEDEGLLRQVSGGAPGHDGVAGVVFHEVGHVLREHFARQGGRDPAAWNAAGDREINDDVLAAGWRLPGTPLTPGEVGMPEGLTAEEYYRPEHRRGKVAHPEICAPGCGANCGGAAGNPTAWELGRAGEPGGEPGGSPPPGGEGVQAPSPADPFEQEIVLRRTARDVAQHARLHGKGSVPAGLVAWAEMKLEPAKIDWRRRLAGLCRRALARAAGAADWSWRRPGRRALHSAGRPGWPLAPSYHRPVPTVGIVLDTSGSMACLAGDGRTREDEALSEVVGLAAACGADCWAVACDAQAYDVVRLRGPRDLPRLNRGGGGTMMKPGFDALRPKACDVVVIVTDGEVGSDWPTAEDCRGRRVIACVVGGTGEEAPDWIETVEVG